MGGEGWRRSTAMRRGDIQRLFQGYANLSILGLEILQIVLGLIWRHPTMGAIEINDFSGMRKLAVDVLQLLPQSIMMRRGRRLRSMANPTVLVSLVRLTTWGGELVIAMKVKA